MIAMGSARAQSPDAFQMWLQQVTSDTDALKRYDMLEKAARGTEPQRKQVAQQLLPTVASELGNYQDAERLNPFQKPHPLVEVRLEGPAAPARDAIVAASKGKRVVMINEYHIIARSRLVTLSILGPLRRAGFTHLALEALNEPAAALAARGHAINETGIYTREPVFAELVREALRLGFKVVPYEYEGPASDQQSRETGQAENLARLLREEPNARLVVHAGHGHIKLTPTVNGARSMATELSSLTGLRPLTIDTTTLIDHPVAANDTTEYRGGIAAWQRTHAGQLPRQAFVLLSETGQPRSIFPSDYDITIFSAPAGDDESWRSLDGRRIARPLLTPSCAATRCLIEARRGDESPDAIPADRRVLEKATTTTLWLAAGCYDIRVQTATGATTERQCFKGNRNR